jgi:hypothetical protein
VFHVDRGDCYPKQLVKLTSLRTEFLSVLINVVWAHQSHWDKEEYVCRCREERETQFVQVLKKKIRKDQVPQILPP